MLCPRRILVSVCMTPLMKGRTARLLRFSRGAAHSKNMQTSSSDVEMACVGDLDIVCFKSHTQLFSSYIKRSRPPYFANFAEIWLAILFQSPNTKMDVRKFQFFLLWKISRRPLSSDTGGLPIWRIEGVLLTSILILPS